MITLHVLGTPAPKGSSRPMLNRKTGKAFTFKGGSPQNAEKLTTWDTNVRAAAAGAVGTIGAPPFVETALSVAITFRLARPGGPWITRSGTRDCARPWAQERPSRARRRQPVLRVPPRRSEDPAVLGHRSAAGGIDVPEPSQPPVSQGRNGRGLDVIHADRPYRGRTDPLSPKSGDPLLELCHTFLERLLLNLFAGTRSLHLLLLFTEARTDLRSLLSGHLRPDPAGAFDLVANAIISVRPLGGACVFGDIADRHG